MAIRTRQPAEVFVNLPPNAGRGWYTPEPPQWTWSVRNKMVPRLFKAANGGAADRDGHNWPPDMSSGTAMGHLPHPAIVLPIPDRGHGLTATGDALRTHSAQRIPPVLVRTRLR